MQAAGLTLDHGSNINLYGHIDHRLPLSLRERDMRLCGRQRVPNLERLTLSLGVGGFDVTIRSMSECIDGSSRNQ